MTHDDLAILAEEQKFTTLELFAFLKKYVAETGACSTVNSAMLLGHVLTKKYQALAQKIEGRVAKHKLVLPEMPRA